MDAYGLFRDCPEGSRRFFAPRTSEVRTNPACVRSAHMCVAASGGSTLGFFASRPRQATSCARAVQGLPDDSDSGTTQEKASPCIVTIEEGGRAEKKRAQQR